MEHLKPQLIIACQKYVEDRITRILTGIADLEAALKLETKCTVGDKYETGRAMVTLEFEKLSSQLDQFKRLKETLSLINPEQMSNKIAFGSIVKTTAANYFISIPAGEIIIDSEKYFAVGVNSPVAQAVLAKKEGENFELNGKENRVIFVG